MKKENSQRGKLVDLFWFDFKYNVPQKWKWPIQKCLLECYSRQSASHFLKIYHCYGNSDDDQWSYVFPLCCFCRITYLEAPQRAEPNYSKWENNTNDCHKWWWKLQFVFIDFKSNFTMIFQMKISGKSSKITHKWKSLAAKSNIEVLFREGKKKMDSHLM